MQMHRRADKSGTTEIFTGTRKKNQAEGNCMGIKYMCCVVYYLSLL